MNTDQPADGLLYPSIEPYLETGLAVGSGHRIRYELSGNPQGFPVLFLHGGPGSQTRPGHRCYFDPQFYRIVLFDQRGCGRSSPAGELCDNTTHHLVADIEQLRLALGVERWLLFGGSWGSTLALAYAIARPERVAALILRGVFLASKEELDWYLNGLRRFVPEAWQQLSEGDGRNLVERYHALVNHPDTQTAATAARRWVDYEAAAMAIGAPEGAPPTQNDANALVARARVQLHYLMNHCFLRKGELLDNLHRLAGKPTIVVQGRRDMVCPPVTAWEVASRLPGAELRMIGDGGHSASDAPMAPALRRAADDMRRRL